MKPLLPLNEYYKTLPKKHVGAGVLFFDAADRLLIVKPSYKDGWSIPGGVIDPDESPLAGAIRETKEEIDLDVKDISLVCVDYVFKEGEKPESLQFLFYGGILQEDIIQKITIDGEELLEFRFAEIPEALILLREGLRKRLPYCLDAIKNKVAVYLETDALQE